LLDPLFQTGFQEVHHLTEKRTLENTTVSFPDKHSGPNKKQLLTENRNYSDLTNCNKTKN